MYLQRLGNDDWVVCNDAGDHLTGPGDVHQAAGWMRELRNPPGPEKVKMKCWGVAPTDPAEFEAWKATECRP